MPTGGAMPVALSDQDREAFLAALEERRTQVYDYLDAWPGSAHFRPPEIYDAIYSYIRRRGKALRPLVLLLSCAAVGGDEEQALPAAAAVEVFHTWTLVHDDIIDRDDTRRGRPTVHAEFAAHAARTYGLDLEQAAHYGRAVAILAGDSQQSWAYALLGSLVKRGVSPVLVVRLIDRMATWLTPELLAGEMLDVQYSLTPPEELSENQVLNMLTRKTGALLEYAAWCGATIGLGGKPDPHDVAGRLGNFATLCGTAFQLRDDILGLTADEARLGKPVGSDLREGKRTLIVHAALANGSERERQKILAVLGNPTATRADIDQALLAIHETGALVRVEESANLLISQAHAILAGVPDTPHRKLLTSWASFLLARQY
ncbi:MAG: polyprenyl synthetase family protein [Chloroflexia bacterium]